jgi:hypothetical protein
MSIESNIILMQQGIKGLTLPDGSFNQLEIDYIARKICTTWKLRPLQMERLIGRTKEDIGSPLDICAVGRLYLVYTILLALQEYLPQHGNDRRWIKAPNSYFDGDSPLKAMTESCERTMDVLDYIIAMRLGK